MRRPPTKSHNYLPKILALQASGAIKPGSAADVDIRHDDWCDVHSGGFCNCDPDVSLRSYKQ